MENQNKNTCPACESPDYRIIRDTIRYDIKRNVRECMECGLVYLEALIGSFKDYYAGRAYKNRYGPAPDRSASVQEIFDAYRPFQDDIIQEIRHLLRPKTSVLDIGCQTGHFLDALKGKVGTRVGLELGQEEVAFIRKQFDFPVYDALIENTEIAKSPFDLITCIQVLEHVENPRSFLEGVRKHLKPGGHVYIEIPNLNEALLTCYPECGYRNFHFHEPHILYFSVPALKKLLDEAGFVGEYKTVQRYNLLNHINWILTGKPQQHFSRGNQTPKLITDSAAPRTAASDLNEFIARADKEYKNILKKHGLGEMITFIGTKTK